MISYEGEIRIIHDCPKGEENNCLLENAQVINSSHLSQYLNFPILKFIFTLKKKKSNHIHTQMDSNKVSQVRSEFSILTSFPLWHGENWHMIE